MMWVIRKRRKGRRKRTGPLHIYLYVNFKKSEKAGISVAERTPETPIKQMTC